HPRAGGRPPAGAPPAGQPLDGRARPAAHHHRGGGRRDAGHPRGLAGGGARRGRPRAAGRRGARRGMSAGDPPAGARWTWDGALTGVVPPVISPLDAGREVDEPAIAALVAHVLEAGCTGLFALGGCGEGAWLTARQRGAVVRAFVREAAGRVPVLA